MKTASDRTLTIERTFDAPLNLVWQAWTQAEHIARWWGPKGMEPQVVLHEFKEGGHWKYVTQMPNGGEFSADGIYLQIVPKERIHSTANFRPMTEGVETLVLLEEKDGKTAFTFHCIHPTAEYCQQQKEMGFYNGWGSVLTRLQDYLAKA